MFPTLPSWGLLLVCLMSLWTVPLLPELSQDHLLKGALLEYPRYVIHSHIPTPPLTLTRSDEIFNSAWAHRQYWKHFEEFVDGEKLFLIYTIFLECSTEFLESPPLLAYCIRKSKDLASALCSVTGNRCQLQRRWCFGGLRRAWYMWTTAWSCRCLHASETA